MTPAELRARVAGIYSDLVHEAMDAERERERFARTGDVGNAGEACGRWRACESVMRRLSALLSEYDASARGGSAQGD